MAESTSSSVSQGADRARIRRLERELADTKSRLEAEIASNQSKLDEIERSEADKERLVAAKDRVLEELDVALGNHPKASGNHRDGDEHKQLQAKIAELEKAHAKEKADANEIRALRERDAMLEDTVASVLNKAFRHKNNVGTKKGRIHSEIEHLLEKDNSPWQEETDYYNDLRSIYNTVVASRVPSGGTSPSEISRTVGLKVEAGKTDTAKPGKVSEEGFTTPATLAVNRPPSRVSIETQNACNNPFAPLSASQGPMTQHSPPDKATASHRVNPTVSRGQTKRMRHARGGYRNTSPPRSQNTPSRGTSGPRGQTFPYKLAQAARPQTPSNPSAPSSVMTATAKPPTFATPAGPSNAPPPRKQIGVTEIFKQPIYESPSASAPSTKTPKPAEVISPPQKPTVNPAVLAFFNMYETNEEQEEADRQEMEASKAAILLRMAQDSEKPAEVKSSPQKRTVNQNLSALYGFDDTDEEEEAEKEAREARKASVLQRIAQDSKKPAPLKSMTPDVDGGSSKRQSSAATHASTRQISHGVKEQPEDKRHPESHRVDLDATLKENFGDKSGRKWGDADDSEGQYPNLKRKSLHPSLEDET